MRLPIRAIITGLDDERDLAFEHVREAFELGADPDRVFISLEHVTEILYRILAGDISVESALISLDPDKPKGY